MTTAPTKRNGFDVDRLVATIGAIEGQPELASFRFHARTTWAEGGRARTTIQDFFGAGGEDTSHTRPIILEGDEPRLRPGYQQIRVAFKAETDAPADELEALWEHVQRTSPVLDIVRNPVSVTLSARG